MRPLIQVDASEGELRFRIRGMREPLLELTYRPERSSETRTLYEITGGKLLRKGPQHGVPRLEFRLTGEGHEALAAVQDYQPALPWWLYAATQSPLHHWVMLSFARHLRRTAIAPGS